MRKVSWVWKETAEIIGVLGVIGSLIFVAFEIRQNNELLAAEARAKRHENRSHDSNRQFLDNPQLAELVLKSNSGQQLTDIEQFTMERMFNQMLLNFQYVYVESQQGQLDERDLNISLMKHAFYSNAGKPQYWKDAAEKQLLPDFIQWMNENIVESE